MSNRTLSALLGLSVVAMLAAAVPAPSAEEPTPALEAGVAPEPATLPTLGTTESCSASESVESLDLRLGAEGAWSCRYGQPYCTQDSQCDAYCGPGWGDCYAFCCWCLG